MNTISIIGRLTANPELKEFKTKNAQTKKTEKIHYVNFCVAIDRVPKNEKEPADFIQCTAWRQKADLIYEYFSKGSLIGIVGELHSHSYEQVIIDPETRKKKKVKRTSYDVMVTDLTFCSSKSSKKEDKELEKEFDDDDSYDDEDEDDDDEDDTELPFDV